MGLNREEAELEFIKYMNRQHWICRESYKNSIIYQATKVFDHIEKEMGLYQAENKKLKAKLQAYEDNKEVQFSGTARMCYQKNTDFFASRILNECDHEETFKVIIFKDKR